MTRLWPFQLCIWQGCAEKLSCATESKSDARRTQSGLDAFRRIEDNFPANMPVVSFNPCRGVPLSWKAGQMSQLQVARLVVLDRPQRSCTKSLEELINLTIKINDDRDAGRLRVVGDTGAVASSSVAARASCVVWRVREQAAGLP